MYDVKLPQAGLSETLLLKFSLLAVSIASVKLQKALTSHFHILFSNKRPVTLESYQDRSLELSAIGFTVTSMATYLSDCLDQSE